MNRSDQLRPQQRTLLETVYSHWAADGRWPLTRDLRKELHSLGYIEGLVAALGPDLIVCNFILDDPHADCRLGLEALGLIPAAQVHRDLVVKAVRYLSQRYIQSRDHPPVLSARELGDGAGLSKDQLREVLDLLRKDDLVIANYYECTPHACTVAGYPDLELSHALAGMASVIDYDGFLEKRREYRAARVRLLGGGSSDDDWRTTVNEPAAGLAAQPQKRHIFARIRRVWKGLAAVVVTLAALVGITVWWQSRVRVSIDVRHYVHDSVSEGTVGKLRDWVRQSPGRAYDVVDVVWRNTGDVPETEVTILIRIPQAGEILTCDLARPSLRPRLRIGRDPNECEVGLDRIAAGSTDSVRVRFRSPVVEWIYKCDVGGMKGDVCGGPRPSAHSSYPVSVSAEGNGPPIKVRTTTVTVGSPVQR